MENIILNSLALHTTPEIDGMVIMAFVVFTLALLYLGLTTKYKVFLIFSIGGNIALMEFFREIPALILTLVGLTIFELWYATLGADY